jgi:hypothetical protein
MKLLCKGVVLGIVIYVLWTILTVTTVPVIPNTAHVENSISSQKRQ